MSRADSVRRRDVRMAVGVLVPERRRPRHANRDPPAAMLPYAAGHAEQRFRGAPREGSVAAALLNAGEHEEDGTTATDLALVVDRLFRDAGVKAHRADRRGQAYSLVDAAIQEFVRWDSMPWE